MTTEDLRNLEKSVQCAGHHLDSVQSRLTHVERTLVFDDDEVDCVQVMEVLDSVTEVKNEYQKMHKDIKEVQQLQKEMTASLQYQLRSMHQTFKILKKRLELRTQPLPTISVRSPSKSRADSLSSILFDSSTPPTSRRK